MKKKLMFMSLTICLSGFLMVSCTSNSSDSTTGTDGTDPTSTSSSDDTTLHDEVIGISTEAELKAIADDLYAGYELLNPITLTEVFAPIGNYDEPFRGQFYGNGFAINGLSLDISQGTYVTTIDAGARCDITFGIFGAAKNAVIDNVVLNNVQISGQLVASNAPADTKIRAYVGSLVGYSEKSMISNVVINGITTDISNTTEGELRHGGLTGWQSGDVSAIQVKNANIKVTSTLESRVGGITGNMDNGTISNSEVSLENIDLTVTGSKAKAGGIAGITEKDSLISLSKVTTIESGKIKTVSSSKQAHSGGIVGLMESGEVDNCLVNAQIYAVTSGDKPAYAGGITSALEDEVGNPFVRHSVSLGKVTAESQGNSINSFAGGLVGRFEGVAGPDHEFHVEVKNSYSGAEVIAIATKNANGAPIIGGFSFGDSNDIADYLADNFVALFYGNQDITFTKTNDIGVKLASFNLAQVGLSTTYWNYSGDTITLNI